ncbi:hypothetical protein BC831DRAFT_466432 [Entophlyctis helioformis]|nr:hypothetical protein BC831DRAFT_466432 [Entophlyctis helioformis]
MTTSAGQATLAGLPVECIQLILSFMPPASAARLSCASRSLQGVVDGYDLLWLDYCNASCPQIADVVNANANANARERASSSLGSPAPPSCSFRTLYAFVAQGRLDVYAAVARRYGTLLGLWHIDYPFFNGGVLLARLVVQPQDAKTWPSGSFISESPLSINRLISVDDDFVTVVRRSTVFEETLVAATGTLARSDASTTAVGPWCRKTDWANRSSHRISFRTVHHAHDSGYIPEPAPMDPMVLVQRIQSQEFPLGAPDAATGLWPYPSAVQQGSDTTLAQSWADHGIDVAAVHHDGGVAATAAQPHAAQAASVGSTPTGSQQLSSADSLLQAASSSASQAYASASQRSSSTRRSAHPAVLAIDCEQTCFRKRIASNIETHASHVDDVYYTPLCSQIMLPTQKWPDDVTRLWVGSYGGHGCEVILLRYVQRHGRLELWAYKVTGDINVPRGEITFRAFLGNGVPSATVGSGDGAWRLRDAVHEFGAAGRAGGAVAYPGQGTIAMRGYQSPARIRCDVIFVSETELQVYWESMRKIARFKCIDGI